MTSPTADRAQRWAAAALTAFGIAAVVQARTLPFGSITRPAAGFFPMCLAVGLTLVAAAVLVRSFRERHEPTANAEASAGRFARGAATLVALLVYAFALDAVGFGVATFLLITFLFRVIEPHRWIVALGGAAVTVAVTHVVFRIWLGVRLPIGPWGF
ncbi:MAG: tripartite tricarboxylate transporter TctB family protein [Candidatus Rokubacteria bacterium]|nr:tripartite tricarboxylate transporter TctB family protein [Candidatus Rokubacteria bacterium]